MSNESVYSNKLHPGSAFPSISAALLNGEKTVWPELFEIRKKKFPFAPAPE